MFRTALKPRWLALLVVVLTAATAMAALGNWQLQRARDRGADATADRRAAQPKPIESLIRARETFPGRLVDAPVVARGQWDAEGQILVADRVQGGVRGFWVLTPLVLADGSAVGVVRGWTPDAAAARTDAPSGAAEVRGILRPAEPPPARAPGAAALPPDRLRAVDVTSLVKLWPQPLVTGYVLATDPAPGLERVVTPDEDGGGLALRNLSYALQWWLFAAFGLFFWWRLVRDDARGVLRPTAASGEAAPEDGEGGAVGDDVPVLNVQDDPSQKVEHA